MYLLFAVHIGSWLICDIFYVPPVCIPDIYSPKTITKHCLVDQQKTQMKFIFNDCSISVAITNFNFKWTLPRGVSQYL